MDDRRGAGRRREDPDGGSRSPGPGGPQTLLDGSDAAELLQVALDRLAIMIEQELLGVVLVEGEQRFVRAEVLAVRLLGG
jgi:hypothetical protein